MPAPDFQVVVPARYESTRLPGKPLADLAGSPMVVRVLERGRASGAARVIVATDDERVAEPVRAAGGEVRLTRRDHTSGTDRLAEVAAAEGWPDSTIVVNLQGDEPLLPPELPGRLAAALDAHDDAGIATVAVPIEGVRELFDPNAVKVVRDARGFALLFSRAPLPWVRGAFADGPPAELPTGVPFCRHVGLYAYRVGTLRRIAECAPSAIERAECLEQLRAMSLGIRIHVSVLEHAPPPGVDTASDLARVQALFEREERDR